jgi:hypothetical protein
VNWGGITIAIGIVAVCLAMAPWGLIVLVLLWLAMSGKLWKP